MTSLDILNKLSALLAQLSQKLMENTENGRKIYDTAFSLLGKDASPADRAPDYLGCAESVFYVIKQATGRFSAPHEQPVVSTTMMYRIMLDNPKRFMVVSAPLPGDIIISPTGYGTNPYMPNGHVGICGKEWVMSNSSETGLWTANYTPSMWKKIYQQIGGYPVVYVRVLD